jgi:hypothetical protein
MKECHWVRVRMRLGEGRSSTCHLHRQRRICCAADPQLPVIVPAPALDSTKVGDDAGVQISYYGDSGHAWRCVCVCVCACVRARACARVMGQYLHYFCIIQTYTKRHYSVEGVMQEFGVGSRVVCQGSKWTLFAVLPRATRQSRRDPYSNWHLRAHMPIGS